MVTGDASLDMHSTRSLLNSMYRARIRLIRTNVGSFCTGAGGVGNVGEGGGSMAAVGGAMPAKGIMQRNDQRDLSQPWKWEPQHVSE